MATLRTALAAHFPQVRQIAAWATAFRRTGDGAPVLELGECLEAFD